MPAITVSFLQCIPSPWDTISDLLLSFHPFLFFFSKFFLLLQVVSSQHSGLHYASFLLCFSPWRHYTHSQCYFYVNDILVFISEQVLLILYPAISTCLWHHNMKNLKVQKWLQPSLPLFPSILSLPLILTTLYFCKLNRGNLYFLIFPRPPVVTYHLVPLFLSLQGLTFYTWVQA